MNQRVLICGYYGFGNTGDEAILAAMLAELRAHVPGVEVTVLSGAPADTDRRHDVRAIHWIDIPSILNAARSADLMVLGGGGLFHDYWGVNGSTILTHTHTGIGYWTGFALLASLVSKPLQIWAVGVGPLLTADGRELTRLAFDLAAHSSVRDDGSRALLTGIGVDPGRVALSADPVWRIGPPDLRHGRKLLARAGAPSTGTVVGVALRSWTTDVAEEWQQTLATELDRFLEADDDRTIVFIPFQRLVEHDEDDSAAARAVRGRMHHASRTRTWESTLDVADVHSILAVCDAVIAMRLHASILAASAGIPVIALEYDPKVASALEALGAQGWSVSLDRTGLANVVPLVNRALLERHEIGSSLTIRARALAEEARSDGRAAAELLAHPRHMPLPPSAGRWLLGALETQARRVAALPVPADPAVGEAIAVRMSVLREELLRLRLENDALHRELNHWKHSRLWRTADVYWRLRRALRMDPSATGGNAHSFPAEAPRIDAAPQPLEHAPPSARASEAAAEARPAIPEGFPALPAGTYDVVVLSIIDWDFRFQRPQQLATQFARHGHRVFYVSTTKFLPSDGPAWHLESKSERVAELQLRTPEILNVYGGRLDAAALAMLDETFHELSSDLAIGDAVCVVQIPYWAPLAERLRSERAWRVVYDCMDEWTHFPGFGADVLSLERGLVESADLTVVSALRLQEKWGETAKRLVLAQNGVDLEHYRQHYGPNELLAGASRPIIGYYGALASWVDVPLLERVAAAFPEATIVLAGGHFDVDLAPLGKFPNVRLLGQRPYVEMPQLLWHFDVCLIPFHVNEITEATNPVKFYEYLSAGKPVVAPPLTELLPYRDVCYLASGIEPTIEAIREALSEPPDDPRRDARIAIAAANDWSARYAVIHGHVRRTFPLISVVMVTHGGLELTRACIDSLLGSETWPRLEVIVVDNNSNDETVTWVRKRTTDDDRLRIIENTQNRGFPAANNQGIDAATGEVIVLLNNDTVVPPGLLGRLTAHLRHPRIGLVCPTTNFCGNEARVEPSYESIEELPRFAAERYARYAGRRFDLPVAAMYCVAARRDTFERVGPLDERFGIGMFEDDDYSERVRNAGLRVVCAEDAYVHHVGQGAFRHLSPDVYRELWRKNQEYYEHKWGRPWRSHSTRSGVARSESVFKGDGSRV